MSEPRPAGSGRRPGARGWLFGVFGFALVGAAILFSIESVRVTRAARSAFPLADGRLELPGLQAGLEIFRDEHGVPHIEATTAADAFFGWGFAQAQDRLAQMRWLLRVARGRTAELVGADGLAADRLNRTLGLGALAEAELARMDAETRGLLEAYARGVSARIERVRSGRAAPPLALAEDPGGLEDWTAADSLAVAKLHAWSLSNSLDVSLVLADLIERLGGLGARRFFPNGLPAEGLPAPPGSGFTARLGGGLVPDPLRRAARLEGRSIGSSAWVIGGAHSRSGSPLLAADAHLEPTVPALLHVAHVRGGGIDVLGAAVPGLPAFWSGANQRVAWSATNALAVTTDLYVETLSPTDPRRYHDGRRWTDVDERVELILVRGAEPETLTVRATRHGPLIHKLLAGSREPLAVAWAGARPGAGAFLTLLALARAEGAADLLHALEAHQSPAIAVAFADAAGEAGTQLAGWIPRRTLATGLVPLPGRARWYDWNESVPFGELPGTRLVNGKGWAIASDNAWPQRSESGHIEWLWRTGERAGRIDELLRAAVARGPLELQDMTQLQRDVGAVRAASLISMSLELAEAGGRLGDEEQEVASLLRAWDGRATATSVGAAAYHVFLESLAETLLGEHLGEELLRRYLALPRSNPAQVVYGIVRDAATAADVGGWADPQQVTRALRESLRETWYRLSYRLGANRAKWTWGRLHPLRFATFVPLAAVPSAEGLGPFAYGGSDTTVNAAEYDPAETFSVRVASTFRFAVDTGALDHAFHSLAPGQSEHPQHPHFRAGLERWLEGRPFLLTTSRLQVEESSASRLVLAPQP